MSNPVVVIDSNIPIPPIEKRFGRPVDPNSCASVMRRLEVGQSIDWGDRHKKAKGACGKVAKDTGAKFSWRGTRVWRVA